MLGDNMGLTLCVSKGRCQNVKLLMLMRRLSALLLATGARVYARWLPSEINPADEGSRAREPPSTQESHPANAAQSQPCSREEPRDRRDDAPPWSQERSSGPRATRAARRGQSDTSASAAGNLFVEDQVREATKRRQTVGMEPHDTMEQMGITEENSVTTKTRDKYKKAVKDFLAFVCAT